MYKMEKIDFCEQDLDSIEVLDFILVWRYNRE